MCMRPVRRENAVKGAGEVRKFIFTMTDNNNSTTPARRVVVAFSRLTNVYIGKNGPYGAKLYGDKTSGNEFVLPGSFTGRSDAPMFKAFEHKLPVLSCIHAGRKQLLPAPVGVGFVTSVNENENENEKTRNTFRVEVKNKVPFKGFVPAEPESPSNCWIKRQFLRNLGLEAMTRNYTCGFIECRVTESTPRWVLDLINVTP